MPPAGLNLEEQSDTTSISTPVSAALSSAVLQGLKARLSKTWTEEIRKEEPRLAARMEELVNDPALQAIVGDYTIESSYELMLSSQSTVSCLRTTVCLL
jgi:hypothetical protein